MKLSPLDIYDKEFKKSTFGYNPNQVKDFLDEVGVAYEALLKEINKLKDENEKYKERLAEYEKLDERLDKMLVTVQETAQEQVRQAEQHAKMIIQKAEHNADKMKQEVKAKLEKEYKALQEIKENKKLFQIRFKTLLESHLDMLESNLDIETDIAERDVAAINTIEGIEEE